MANPEIEERLTKDRFTIGTWELSLKTKKLSLIIDKVSNPRGWKVMSVCKSVLNGSGGNIFCSDCSNTACKVRDALLSGKISVPQASF